MNLLVYIFYATFGIVKEGAEAAELKVKKPAVVKKGDDDDEVENNISFSCMLA